MNTRELRAVRTKWGLTQEDLAHVLQVHPLTVSKAERGRQQLPARCIPWLELLAHRLPREDLSSQPCTLTSRKVGPTFFWVGVIEQPEDAQEAWRALHVPPVPIRPDPFDAAAEMDALCGITWSTPHGRVTGVVALGWIGRSGFLVAPHLLWADAKSGSDRRARRLGERLKERGLVRWDAEQSCWTRTARGRMLQRQVRQTWTGLR